MNPCRFLACLIVAVCPLAGFAQSTTPSLTIGPHVLTIGMAESEVLEQLGNDLILRMVQKGTVPPPEWTTSAQPESAWTVEKDLGGMFVVLGQVGFTNHRLVSVSRNFEVKDSSARSLFNALDLASRKLEEEGFTNCQLTTMDRSYAVENGNLSTRQVNLNCGAKGITIYLTTSDAPHYVSTAMRVREWLHGS